MRIKFTRMLCGEELSEVVSPIRIIGDPKKRVAGATSLHAAKGEDLSFCTLSGMEGFEAVGSSKAGILICHEDIPELEVFGDTKCLMSVLNPRIAFIRCLNRYVQSEVNWGVHPTAIIEQGVILPKRVYIGPMAYIGEGAEIGEETIIENRVHVGPRTRLGKNVYLQVGAVIGCTGQGFERNEEGVLEKFPQVGSVEIEDNVEVGANSTIVRGAFAETRIGRGSKIGHLTDIGHNAEIGCHVFISAEVVVGGSSRIGDFSWLAPKCSIRNKVRIGKNVTVGLGSVVTKDVPEGMTVIGSPARELEDQKKLLRHCAELIGHSDER